MHWTELNLTERNEMILEQLSVGMIQFRNDALR